jgi:peptidoglycan/LPS O-acetylase OafA/YrhL
MDGDRSREPLTLVFGTWSIAEVAVAGFFLVSGYLITQSYETSSSTLSYLTKRCRRIYPGFVAASMFCVLVVGPLAGANLRALSVTDWLETLVRTLAQQVPKLEGAFSGQNYPSLNGSMWTIPYEFRCYLALPILACLGPLNRKIALSAAIATWFAALATSPDWPRLPFEGAIGNFHESMRLAALFLTGACYFLYRERISYTGGLAAIAAIGLAVALLNRSAAGPAVGILGGYLIFWFAFMPGTPLLNEINSKIDLSYGIYLYAWPVQMLLIRYIEGITPGLIILFTVVIAGLLAYLSWTFVEQPFLSGQSPFLSAYTLRRRPKVHATVSAALNQSEEEVVAASSDRPLDLSRRAQT